VKYFARGGREAEKASDFSQIPDARIANPSGNAGNTGRTGRAEKASDLSHSLTPSSVSTAPTCVPKSSVPTCVPKLWKPAETPRANSLNSVTNSLNSVTNSAEPRQLPRPTTTPPYVVHPSPRDRGEGGWVGGGGIRMPLGIKMPLTQLTGNSQPPVDKGGCGGGGGRGVGGNGEEEWIQRVIPAGLQFFR
jgi:hypothetical protein